MNEGMPSVENVLKEMIKTEREAKKIIEEGEKEAAEIIADANNKARGIIEEKQGLAKKESDELLTKTAKEANSLKSEQINRSLEEIEKEAALAAEKKQDVYAHILKWLKNEV